jgi:hypothetical protein
VVAEKHHFWLWAANSGEFRPGGHFYHVLPTENKGLLDCLSLHFGMAVAFPFAGTFRIRTSDNDPIGKGEP